MDAIKKQKCNLSKENFLQVHHTINQSECESKRIRFMSIVFDDENERFACSDYQGNAFIFDLECSLYWSISGHAPGAVTSFSPWKKNEIFYATYSSPFETILMNPENFKVNHKLLGHNRRVKMTSFSSSKDLFITASSIEAIIWESKCYTMRFKLNICKDKLKNIKFVPLFDNIIAAFRNSGVKIWCRKTLELTKMPFPKELSGATCFEITSNGKYIIIGSHTILVEYNLTNWEVTLNIDIEKSNINGVKSICLMPKASTFPRTLGILSYDHTLYIFDLKQLVIVYSFSSETSNIEKIISSLNSKYLACIFNTGEINVYKVSSMFEDTDIKCCKKLFLRENALCSPSSELNKKEDETYCHGIDSLLTKSRIKNLLSKGSKYPEKYRLIIWKLLLEVPENCEAYCDLIKRPVHPFYQNFEEHLFLSNSKLLRHTKRILSSLSYWSPVVGRIKYLDSFIFPFVKVMCNAPLFCFEAIMTILVNYCQFWFEHTPLPPINVLALIENLLSHSDTLLLRHFKMVGVTTKVYAFSLMKSAFSESLSCDEWLQLWDHILSNEPSFILMAVVAYNIIYRNTLISFDTIQEFEDFYTSQNPINMKAFLCKCYSLLNDTDPEVHPRQFLKPFSPLLRGPCYQQYSLHVIGKLNIDM